jgi:hypothetical protein
VIAFASGDSGHDGGVLYPATSQYVVAVGGTSLIRGTTPPFTERAWSGAGSGCSAYEPQLGWQVGPPDTQRRSAHSAPAAVVARAAGAASLTRPLAGESRPTSKPQKSVPAPGGGRTARPGGIRIADAPVQARSEKPLAGN